MANIVDYIRKYGKYNFNQLKFNNVDSLILCQLTYEIFDKYAPLLTSSSTSEDDGLKMFDIVRDKKKFYEAIEPTLYPAKNKEFLIELIKSKRFRNVTVNYFKSLFDYESETQFAAMTFKLDNDINYIAFRGTDISILGWKEDFNMSILDEIPSQTLGVNYLNDVIPLLKGIIFVGGQSKGGNIARFSSTFVSSKYQALINHVFDHDGPGIQRDLTNEPRYKKIEQRITKTIPYDSIIGILLSHSINCKIVKSKSVFILQHDPFNWLVDLSTHDFEYATDTAFLSKINDVAINMWITSISKEHKKIIIKCLFDIFNEANIKTVKDISSFPITRLYRSIYTLSNFTKEEKDIIFKTVTSLVKIWFELLGQNIKDKFPSKNKRLNRENKYNREFIK